MIIPNKSKIVVFLTILEILINIWIIGHVAYTEIDWKTYMQQVEVFLRGEWNYQELVGDTGPIAYPAGHLYIFSILYHLTSKGENILGAQIIFGLVYLATLLLVCDIYSHCDVPGPYLILLCLSRRCHSIHVLRLFNDPICMMFLYGSISLLVRRKLFVSTLVLGLALSIKMNVLLFIPGYMVFYVMEYGIVGGLLFGSCIVIIQGFVGLPFLWHDWRAYLGSSFDLSRQFLQQWSVNLQFVPLYIFDNKWFHLVLVVGHMILLWSLFRRQLGLGFREYIRIGLGLEEPTKLSNTSLVTLLFRVNLAGILVARSLHYQFYCWYFHSIPLLLWKSTIPIPIQPLVYLIVELCWNIYPPNMGVSLVLTTIHAYLLYKQAGYD